MLALVGREKRLLLEGFQQYDETDLDAVVANYTNFKRARVTIAGWHARGYPLLCAGTADPVRASGARA